MLPYLAMDSTEDKYIVQRNLTDKYERRITNLCNNLRIVIVKNIICLSHLSNWSIIIPRYFTFEFVFKREQLRKILLWQWNS